MGVKVLTIIVTNFAPVIKVVVIHNCMQRSPVQYLKDFLVWPVDSVLVWPVDSFLMGK